MADQSTDQVQNVTQELYKKNLELVNANKEMTLLQRLYESMAAKLNLEELTQEFVQTIVEHLEFQGGLMAMRYPGKQYLQYVAAHFKKNNEAILRSFRAQKSEMHVSLNHDANVLVKSFHQQSQVITEDPSKVLVPLLSVDKSKSTETEAEFTSAVVYPLSFGSHHIATLSIFLKQDVSELSEFDKEVLKRVSTVFGVALDRVMIYQDLKEANKKLKMLDKLKDEFVSIASHELRTPLTAVKGYLWLALNKSPSPLPKEVEANLKIAHDSTERLSRMVEDMLTISRIEGHRLKLELEEFDLADLLAQVHSELSVRASAKNIEFGYEKPDGVLMYTADKEKIRECAINLMGNALKFTPEKGKITLILEKTAQSLIIRVRDTGPGMSPEDKQKLFQKFSKMENSYQHVKESGSGLGLYITKQFVDMHGGSITVDSELGKGTTFSIILPIKSKLEAK